MLQRAVHRAPAGDLDQTRPVVVAELAFEVDDPTEAVDPGRRGIGRTSAIGVGRVDLVVRDLHRHPIEGMALRPL